MKGWDYCTEPGGASKQSRSFAYEKNVNEKEKNINVEIKQAIARKKQQILLMKMILLYWLPERLYIIWLATMGSFQKLTVLTSSLRVALELCV